VLHEPVRNEEAVSALMEIVASRLGLSVQETWRTRLHAIVEALAMPADPERRRILLRQWERERLDIPAWRRIINAVTIGETRFLRQKSWFRQIERLALAPLIRHCRQQNTLSLCLWSAGCSTGEEPYTLALMLRELLPDFAAWTIEIHATDIHGDAIEAAERGEYEARQLRELEDWQIARFFVPAGPSRFAVAPDLRRGVKFRNLNLTEFAAADLGGGEGSFDLIICRNVLMYMAPPVQRIVATSLVNALKPRGWLAVSPAEASAEWFKPLIPVNAAEAILFSKAPVAPRASPPLTRHADPSAAHSSSTAEIKSPAIEPIAPTDLSAKLRALRLLADRGLLEEARTQCQAVLAVDRLNSEASLLLAEICSELNDLPAAYEAARQAVYLAPSSPHAHFLLAGALSRLGRIAPARKALSVARALADGESGTESRMGEASAT
jgi:chemotaxis protein methyltransferase CheR